MIACRDPILTSVTAHYVIFLLNFVYLSCQSLHWLRRTDCLVQLRGRGKVMGQIDTRRLTCHTAVTQT